MAALAGMLLIAATYGMARFGVGLFAPYLAADRPELVPVLGWAAGAQFTSYAVAATVAARLVAHAPRGGLILAGVTATLGCLGVAVATAPPLFIIAVFIGGMGGGFASPALVPIIDVVVAPAFSSTAQSEVNTGTAVGVIASVAALDVRAHDSDRVWPCGAGAGRMVVDRVGFGWTPRHHDRSRGATHRAARGMVCLYRRAGAGELGNRTVRVHW
ncbi:membrane hypothetical protein [Citricoccus sp. K5]|nr:membrane hypothetical protein [Citricoccus sp. K5]